MRRPPAVLVHRQPHPFSFGQLDGPQPEIDVRHEWFLAEDVLSRLDGGAEHRGPLVGVRRQVDDLDIVAAENVTVVRADVRRGVE